MRNIFSFFFGKKVSRLESDGISKKFDAGTALAIGAVDQLCELLLSTEVKKLFSGNEVKLGEFESHVRQIKTILCWKSVRGNSNSSLLDFIQTVKETVYDVEDWLDEQLVAPMPPKVHGDITATSPFKELKQKLLDYIKNASDMGTNVLSDDHSHRPKLIRPEEMYSNVEIFFGRDDEKEELVSMLLSDMQDNVHFVAVVGMGGMGKTTLSQFVYNDSMTRSVFDILLWVHVSEDWKIDNILAQCLDRYERDNLLSTDELVNQVRDKLQGKRYLLVLDDVWMDDHSEWVRLRSYLPRDTRGSRVLLTTRLQSIARVSADEQLFVGGIDFNTAFSMFNELAFLPGQEVDDELHSVAKQFAQRCKSVPLAIKVIAPMFYGQDKDTCRFLANSISLEDDDNEWLIPLLCFSYEQLTPELKACFGFCSLFPKGYNIHKEALISMWLAQGYLVPTNTAQNMEQLGEEYIYILLHRGFFHNIQRNEHGEIISFEIHDVMHDLALYVAGNERFLLTHADSFPPTGITRHLYIDEYASLNPRDFIKISETLRTILNCRGFASSSLYDVAILISECTSLRLLDLSNMALKTLPDIFDKVQFLRYLDLSNNEDLETLPKSITTLHNLRVLRLCGCKNLRELPEGLGILRNLRYLNIDGCYKLGLGVLTLAMSVVGGANYKQLNEGKFMSWGSLLNFKADFLNKMGLLSPSNILSTAERVHVLEGGQDDVCRIAIKPCQGIELPSRELVMANTVAGLVSLTLSHICGLQHLTPLSHLSHLKNLYLRRVWNVEYIVSNTTFAYMRKVSIPVVFFPSLEKLVLEWMPNLKGWWKGLTWMELDGGGHGLVDGNGHNVEQLILPSFPCLLDLSIHCCLAMTYFPPCPHVKSLELRGVNEALTFCMKESDLASLEKLIVCYDARVFNSIVRKFVLPENVDVSLKCFHEEQSLQMAREAFQRCATSLRYLSLDGFYNLKNLSGGGIEHLTNLESLLIKGCSRLDLDGMEVDMEEEGMPWKSLQSLSSLKLSHIPNLVNLQKAFQYLTSLQSLHIISCKNLEVLGESVCYLTSLKSLHIENCENLKTLPECLSSLVSLQPPYITNCPKLELP